MKNCLFCAEEIQDSAVFCRHCKKDLVDNNREATILLDGHASWKGYTSYVISSVIFVFILVGIPMLLWLYIKLRTEHYKITTRTIDIETGLLTRHHNTLEVWRIKDIKFTQGIWDRFHKSGTITISSIDKSHPGLSIQGLPNAQEIYTAIKNAASQQRAERKVTSIEL